MEDKILSFDDSPKTKERIKRVSVPLATSNPYDPATSPPDILQYLPPDGSTFGLFSDPYAHMAYHMPKTGNHSAKFWLKSRLEEHSFTDHEVGLIHFLSTHRCATRSQIQKAIFKDTDNPYKVRDFIQKSHQRGIISAFSWITPCQDGRKKPLVYGLTPTGAEAADRLFHSRVPREFKFQPIQFPMGAAPKMMTFFPYLVANELYCQLKGVDRLIRWERNQHIQLSDQTHFRPNYVAEVIKDAGDFKTLWIEVIRITDDWYERTVARFREIQNALEKISPHLKPDRIIIIADSDSRIPIIAAIAEEHMPDAVLRFSTDERLLSGMNEHTFLLYDPFGTELKASPIPFLLPGASGMTASDFLATQVIDVEEEFEF